MRRPLANSLCAAGRRRVAAGAAPASASAPSGEVAAASTRQGLHSLPRIHRNSFSRVFTAWLASRSVKLVLPILTGKRFSSSAAATVPCESIEDKFELHQAVDFLRTKFSANKGVFICGLIRNAGQALDRLSSVSLTETGILPHGPAIYIKADLEKGVITVTDNGMGLTWQDLIASVARIAGAGSTKLSKSAQLEIDHADPSKTLALLDVGFHAAFIVADKVSVSTKCSLSGEQYRWEGHEGSTSYSVTIEDDPENFLNRGSCITLHLKSSDTAFAHPELLRYLVTKYGRTIAYPVYLWSERSFIKEVDGGARPGHFSDYYAGYQQEGGRTQSMLQKHWAWVLVNEAQAADSLDVGASSSPKALDNDNPVVTKNELDRRLLELKIDQIRGFHKVELDQKEIKKELEVYKARVKTSEQRADAVISGSYLTIIRNGVGAVLGVSALVTAVLKARDALSAAKTTPDQTKEVPPDGKDKVTGAIQDNGGKENLGNASGPEGGGGATGCDGGDI
ncbi:hypothetical protein ACP70R_016139 [Stipagrostis hirtigluma subsp. patula]